MSGRISKRAREEAIEACLLGADARTTEARHDVPDAALLAWQAWHVVNGAMPIEFGKTVAEACAELWLEAAALLRDGWSPGDPVYLLSEVQP